MHTPQDYHNYVNGTGSGEPGHRDELRLAGLRWPFIDADEEILTKAVDKYKEACSRPNRLPYLPYFFWATDRRDMTSPCGSVYPACFFYRDEQQEHCLTIEKDFYSSLSEDERNAFLARNISIYDNPFTLSRANNTGLLQAALFLTSFATIGAVVLFDSKIIKTIAAVATFIIARQLHSENKFKKNSDQKALYDLVTYIDKQAVLSGGLNAAISSLEKEGEARNLPGNMGFIYHSPTLDTPSLESRKRAMRSCAKDLNTQQRAC